MEYDSKYLFVVISGVEKKSCTIGPGASGVIFIWMDGLMDGRDCIGIGNLVDDRKRDGRPICMHACMLCMECVDPKSTTSCTYLYFFDSERVVCIFYLFLKTFYIPVATCRMAVERGKRVYIGIVSVCG